MKRILTEKEYQDISKESLKATEKLQGLLSNDGYIEVIYEGCYTIESLQFIKSAEIVEKMDQRLRDRCKRLSNKYNKLYDEFDKFKEDSSKNIRNLNVKNYKLKESMNTWNKIVLYFTNKP